MIFTIRPATRSDFPALQDIELSAFETLRQAGGVSGEAVASTYEQLQEYLDEGFLFAAFDEGGRAVGYAGACVIEGDVYVGEVDVHTDFQRKGIGRALMCHMLDEVRARGFGRTSLTTDRFAQFNAPFYASLGFEIVDGADRPQYLTDIIDCQVKKGLDPKRRVAMILRF